MKNFLSSFLIFIFLSGNLFAQNMGLIRDAETEEFLYDLTRPIFKAAALNPNDIKIYIVNDNSINAFVAAGQNVFINTGLLVKYNRPNVLIGVLAHETGHIASGHLARGSEDMQNSANMMMLTYIAGIATAVAARPDAGMAMIMGGSQIAQRTSLKFTRGQEEAADRLAISYLDKIRYSPAGLMELLQSFSAEEAAYKGQFDEYALTHPVSSKRIEFIKSRLHKAKYNNALIDQSLAPRMPRIVAKLSAFLDDPDKTLRHYSKENDDLSSYAKVIAYFRKGKTDQAIQELEPLIAKNSEDGYLWELKGQILFEGGKVYDAIHAYKKSLDLRPNNNLAKIALATAIISLNSGDRELNNFAITNLKSTLPSEKDDPNVFKQLSAAYNQNKDDGHAYLALAEFNFLGQDKEKTEKYAQLAKDNLDSQKDKSDILRADDLLEVARKITKEEK